MRTPYTLFIFIIITISGSCQLSSNLELENDSIVKAIFTSEEISALESFLYAFDDMVLREAEDRGVARAYSWYFQENDEAMLSAMSADILKKENMSALNQQIRVLKKSSVFPEVYKYCNVYCPFEERTLIEYDLNMQGRYMEFLELLADRNNSIKQYLKLIRFNNSISPGAIAFILKTAYKEADFHNEAIRLVWAAHYITVLTQMDDGVFDKLDAE